jgi:glutathione peroxidase
MEGELVLWYLWPIATKMKDMKSMLARSIYAVIIAALAALAAPAPSSAAELEGLYRRYRDKGFVVLGFPANDFGGQEPGSNKQIAEFCQVNYGVTFPMFTKTSVVGANANPLYRELAARTGKPPRWNFHKYLLDRAGQPVAAFESAVDPADPRVTSQIEKLLSAR